MSWDDALLFTTADLLAREGKLLENVEFPNRHAVVKEIVGERIKARFPHIDDPLSEIVDPSVFSEAALCLNLAIVLRENSTRKDDLFSVRAEFYQRRFEQELERAFSKVRFSTEETGIEIVR